MQSWTDAANSDYVDAPEFQFNPYEQTFAEYIRNEVDNGQGSTWNDRVNVCGSGQMQDDIDEENEEFYDLVGQLSLSRFDVEFLE